ncbi:MAG TPA: HXXEE domain-containing protein [Steroidobacteraceae bacterium]|nr:HXXEE domain-containing protein [Steroidobacteraceae bacterium]
MARPRITLRRLAIALPMVYMLHVAEEAPRFVDWFNAHVEPDISAGLFWSVTGAGLVITLFVAGIAAVAGGRGAALAAVAWTGFLMLANGIFHIVATVVDRDYAPGVVTALLLYLPASGLLIVTVAREHAMSPATVAAVALIGGIPMFIHGWLIVFEGGRLF